MVFVKQCWLEKGVCDMLQDLLELAGIRDYFLGSAFEFKSLELEGVLGT